MGALCDSWHCEFDGVTVCHQPESETILSCDRYTVTTNKHKHNIDKVIINFVCAACSGKLENRDKLTDFVVTERNPYCPYCDCVATKIKHVSRVYWEDMQDIEQFESLPDEMKDRVYPEWRNDADFAPASEIIDVNLLWRK